MSPLLVALGLPFLLGTAVLRCLGIGPRADRLAWAGWSWLAGTFATGLVAFVWLALDAARTHPWAPAAVIALLVPTLHLLGRRVRAVPPLPPREPAPRWADVTFAVVTALVLLLVAERVLTASLAPILSDDEGNFWALKAKVIWRHGGFDAGFAEETASETWVYNKDYPNLNPLLQVWVFGLFGEITHVANRVPIQLFAVAQALVAAAAFRRLGGPLAGAGVLLVLVAPAEARFQAGLAHGDLMAGFGALCALDAWLRARATGEVAWTRLAALGLAVMVYSKNEGLVMLLAAVLAFLVVGLLARRRPRPFLVPCRAWRWALLPLGAVALHVGFNRYFGFESGFLRNSLREAGMVTLFFEQFAERAPAVLRHYGAQVLLRPGHSGFVLVVLPLLLVAGGPFARRPQALAPTLAVLLVVVGQMAIFVGAPHDLDWHLRTAAQRISFQVVPVACLCALLLTHRARPGTPG